MVEQTTPIKVVITLYESSYAQAFKQGNRIHPV